MLSLLMADATPSKVPFYIAGGILALWAVTLSATGVRRPDFPFGAAGQRTVVLVSLVLAVAAIGTAIGTA